MTATETPEATRTARDTGLAILYEHPDWFRPLFRELERRGHSFLPLHPDEVSFEVGRNGVPYRAVFNRMSPSAYLRHAGKGIFYTANLLEHLERSGPRVVNGLQAFRVETSKVLQLEILHRLGLPYPRTRVVHAPERASDAAADLRFPVVAKPNVGGSGAGIQRFESPAELASATTDGRLEPGIDGTLLLQEYIPPKDGHITRVEVLDGRVLYAIRVHLDGQGFNLCPADICRTTDGRELDRSGACPADASDSGLRVEPTEPPRRVQEEVVQIVDAAGMDLGGVEYVEDARDGCRYYYDVNALSNFVADAENVVGFDPTARLVDFLEEVVG